MREAAFETSHVMALMQKAATLGLPWVSNFASRAPSKSKRSCCGKSGQEWANFVNQFKQSLLSAAQNDQLKIKQVLGVDRLLIITKIGGKVQRTTI